MAEHEESHWPATCIICRQPFLSDGEPCCNGIVCQAITNRQIEQWGAVQDAEAILRDSLDVASLVLAGL